MNNEIILDKLDSLSKSKFRSSFHLKEKDIIYIDKIGFNKIIDHAYDFINKNLKVRLDNDGHQTPMKGHPVFIAEHACACCCRGCLYKWHNIPKDVILNDKEINYIVTLLITWIKIEYKNYKNNVILAFFNIC